MFLRSFCFLWVAVSHVAFGQGKIDPDRQDLFIGGQDGYHTYRIPALAITTKGTVLAFCEGRKSSSEDTGDINLLLKRSRDGGKSWSKQRLVYEEGGDEKITIGNPCPIVDQKTGRVHLLFVSDYHQLFSTHSDDDGLTWSAPEEHTDILRGFDYPLVLIATGPVYGIQASGGRLIAPVWICDRERKDRYVNTTKDRVRAGIIYYDDNGKTWRTGGMVPADVAMLHECTVVERKDGSLLMNMRAHQAGYRAVSTSRDGGLSWSEPTLDKELPDPTCQGSLIRLNGDEILFSNLAVSSTGGNRRKLTLRMSADCGRTWPHGRVINEGFSGYSDLAMTDLKPSKGWVINENWKANDKAGTRSDYVNVTMLIGEDPGRILEYKFKGTTIGIAIAAGPDAGIIEYRIDRGTWKKLNLFTRWSEKIHLPWFYTLANELTPGRHKLEVRLITEKDELSNGHACRIRFFYINKS